MQTRWRVSCLRCGKPSVEVVSLGNSSIPVLQEMLRTRSVGEKWGTELGLGNKRPSIRIVVMGSEHLELLEFSEPMGLKHGVDDAKAIERPEPSEREAPERALVVTEQRVEHGDQVLTGLLLGVHLGLEVQRSGAPEGAPPAREDLGADGVRGGEARDDFAE